MTESIDFFKTICFLYTGSHSGMVSQQWSEDSQFQPSQYQIFCSIYTESTKVSSCIQETAHIQGRHHFQIQQNV